MTHEEYHQKAQELLQAVPAEFHAPLLEIVWDQGHAYGYHECLSYLSDWIYQFKKHCSFERYEVRVRDEERARVVKALGEKEQEIKQLSSRRMKM